MAENEPSETDVMSAIDQALKSLDDPEARSRVLAWVVAKHGGRTQPTVPFQASRAVHQARRAEENATELSKPAQLWLKRSGIEDDDRLAAIVSVDQSDIDVVASDIPGDSVKARMHNVFLLRGVAEYLKGGEFKFTDEQIRSTCRHYGAYDADNFSQYLKSFEGEVSGTRKTGYALTAKGQRAAVQLLRAMVAS